PSPAAASVPVEEFQLADRAAEPKRKLLRRAFGPALSALVHLALAILLALVSLSFSDQVPPTLVTAAVADAEPVEQLEQLSAELSVVEPLDQAIPSISEPVSNPAAIDLGPLATEQAAGQSEGIPPRESSVLSLADLAEKSGQGFDPIGQSRGSAQFFGVQAGGQRFVFVVDGSRSMKGDRWKACTYELVSAVRRLTKNQRFYVILFAENCHPMFGAPQPAPFPLPPTEQNIARLIRWLQSYQLEPGAGPYEALQLALAFRPDAIFLLSDGRFSDRTEEFLEEHNRVREDFTERLVPKVAVHTIGFFSRSGQELLKRIADQNGGTYRFVPPPRRD
ncbi:MAG TPA: VWA domain-containing protein, partial [Planctomycetes bacterium]|nr:VWA domain-containing protein [Planctomycetota bacterium]